MKTVTNGIRLKPKPFTTKRYVAILFSLLAVATVVVVVAIFKTSTPLCHLFLAEHIGFSLITIVVEAILIVKHIDTVFVVVLLLSSLPFLLLRRCIVE